MNDAIRKLAELLASYEADEPHWEEEDAGLPVIPWSEIEQDLNRSHAGARNGRMSPCKRCWAEHIVHKARWIVDRLVLDGVNT